MRPPLSDLHALGVILISFSRLELGLLCDPSSFSLVRVVRCPSDLMQTICWVVAFTDGIPSRLWFCRVRRTRRWVCVSIDHIDMRVIQVLTEAVAYGLLIFH